MEGVGEKDREGYIPYSHPGMKGTGRLQKTSTGWDLGWVNLVGPAYGWTAEVFQEKKGLGDDRNIGEKEIVRWPFQ